MNTRLIILPMLVITLSGCDKAKTLVETAKTEIKQRVNKTEKSKQNATNPEFEKLIDRTAEGTVFRKDLPFPNHLEVTMSQRADIAARVFQSNAFGQGSSPMKGVMTVVEKIKRDGDVVTRAVEEMSFSDPAADAANNDTKSPNNKKAPNSQAKPSSDLPKPKPLSMRNRGKTWEAVNKTDFYSAALASQLAPVFDDLLVEYGLSPRPLWFSKHRLKIGDEIEIFGKLLPMLVVGDADGSLKLKLVAFESLAGHPCGVFSIKGSYKRHRFINFEGKTIDEDVTVESGKIWLSVVYPLIIKHELDTIQSYTEGSSGNPQSRIQGAIKVARSITWEPKTAAR